LIGESRWVVGKLGKPVDHFDLFRLDGFSAVEVSARLNKQRTIDARLPADGKPLALGSFAIGLPIVDENFFFFFFDQGLFGDETE